MTQPWLWSLPVLLGLMTCLWGISLVLRDVSIVDVVWAPGFAVVTALIYLTTPSHGLLAHLTLGAVLLWAFRLAVHLGLRARGRGEDSRYAKMRQEHGDAFPLRSLVTVFWLQGGLIWLLSPPLAAAAASAHPPGGWGWLGMAVFLVGFLFEAVADAQLTRFKANPSKRGRVLDSGLWRYSRHPNYFGEALLWWGFYLLAVAAGAPWTVFAPMGMTILLLKVSGVPLLEAHMEEKRPGYAEYIRRTPAFVPWFPDDDQEPGSHRGGS